MAKFVLTAQIELRSPAPGDVRRTVSDIERALKDIKVDVSVTGSKKAAGNLKTVEKGLERVSQSADKMGRAFAVSIKRFAAFSVATRLVGMFTRGIGGAIEEAIGFERQLMKVSQVTGKTMGELKDLTREITYLSTTLGVSSKALLDITRVLSQAGMTARETKIALDALAKTTLAPTFTDITQTAEGAVAIFNQFNKGAKALEAQLGAINAVAGQFAVEAGDLIAVIRRTGGVFKAAGGDLNELIALFTSVRATTRESAESIATGLRTIFTRIQRPSTIKFLKQLGVELVTLDGKFVGPFEAVKRLSKALSDLQPGDLRFVKIAEVLGGFRQIGKVIPLLQQFAISQEALAVAMAGTNSLTKDAETAQGALAVRITKVKEEWLALIRSFTESKTFMLMANTALTLASSLIKIADALKPLLPLMAAMGAIKMFKGVSGFMGGLKGGMSSAGAMPKFNSGGLVGGSGSGDTVPAMLTPGEFVIKKSSVNSIGTNNLQRMNKYAKGGKIVLQDNAIGGFFLKPEEGKDTSYKAAGVKVPPVTNIDSQARLGGVMHEPDTGRGLPSGAGTYSDGVIASHFEDYNRAPKDRQKALGIGSGEKMVDKEGIEQAIRDDETGGLKRRLEGEYSKDIKKGVAKLGPKERKNWTMKGQFSGFLLGEGEMKKNSDLSGQIESVVNAGAVKGLQDIVKDVGATVKAQKLVDVGAIQGNPVAMGSSLKNLLGPEPGGAIDTIEGYVLEGVIGAMSGATVGGGGALFDFPASSLQGEGTKDRLTGLFGGGNNMDKLVKADAKRSAGGDSWGSIRDKVMGDINRGDFGGVDLPQSIKETSKHFGGKIQKFATGGSVQKLGAGGSAEFSPDFGTPRKSGHSGWAMDSTRKGAKNDSRQKGKGFVDKRPYLKMVNQWMDPDNYGEWDFIGTQNAPDEIARGKTVLNMEGQIHGKDEKYPGFHVSQTHAIMPGLEGKGYGSASYALLAGAMKGTGGFYSDTSVSAKAGILWSNLGKWYPDAFPNGIKLKDPALEQGLINTKRAKEAGKDISGANAWRIQGLGHGKFITDKESGVFGTKFAKGGKVARMAKGGSGEAAREAARETLTMSQLRAILANTPQEILSMEASDPRLKNVNWEAIIAGGGPRQKKAASKDQGVLGSLMGKLKKVGASEMAGAGIGDKDFEDFGAFAPLAKSFTSGLMAFEYVMQGGLSVDTVKTVVGSLSNWINDLGMSPKQKQQRDAKYASKKDRTQQYKKAMMKMGIAESAARGDLPTGTISDMSKENVSRDTSTLSHGALVDYYMGAEDGRHISIAKKMAQMEIARRNAVPLELLAAGGDIPGKGDGDTVPALLTPGEFVVNKKSAQSIGYGALHRMNSRGAEGYASGGVIGGPRKLMMGGMMGGMGGGMGSGGGMMMLMMAVPMITDVIAKLSGGGKEMEAAMQDAASSIVQAGAMYGAVNMQLDNWKKKKMAATAEELKGGSAEVQATRETIAATHEAAEALGELADDAPKVGDALIESMRNAMMQAIRAGDFEKAASIDKSGNELQRAQQMGERLPGAEGIDLGRELAAAGGNSSLPFAGQAPMGSFMVDEYARQESLSSGKAADSTMWAQLETATDKDVAQANKNAAIAELRDQEKIRRSLTDAGSDGKDTLGTGKRDRAREEIGTGRRKQEGVTSQIEEKQAELDQARARPDAAFNPERELKLKKEMSALLAEQKTINEDIVTANWDLAEAMSKISEHDQQLVELDARRLELIEQAKTSGTEEIELEKKLVKLNRERNKLKEAAAKVDKMSPEHKDARADRAQVTGTAIEMIRGAGGKDTVGGAAVIGGLQVIKDEAMKAGKTLENYSRQTELSARYLRVYNTELTKGKSVQQAATRALERSNPKMGKWNSLWQKGRDALDKFSGKVASVSSRLGGGADDDKAKGAKRKALYALFNKGLTKAGLALHAAAKAFSAGTAIALAAVSFVKSRLDAASAEALKDGDTDTARSLVDQQVQVGGFEAMASGAMTGQAMGASFGPIGSIIGGIAGGIIGKVMDDPMKRRRGIEKKISEVEISKQKESIGKGVETLTKEGLSSGTASDIASSLSKASMEVNKKVGGKFLFGDKERAKANKELEAQELKIAAQYGAQAATMEDLNEAMKSLENNTIGNGKAEREAAVSAFKVAEANRALAAANADLIKITSTFGAANMAVDNFVMNLKTGTSSFASVINTLKQAQKNIAMGSSGIAAVEKARKDVFDKSGIDKETGVGKAIDRSFDSMKEAAEFTANLPQKLSAVNIKHSATPSEVKDNIRTELMQGVDPTSQMGKVIEGGISKLTDEQTKMIASGQLDISDALSGMMKGMSKLSEGAMAAAVALMKHESTITKLTAERIKSELKLVSAQKQAIDLSMEASNIIAKHGGPAVTPEMRRQAILNKANTTSGRLGLSNMSTGSGAELRGRTFQTLDKFAGLETRGRGSFDQKTGSFKGGFMGAEGLQEDQRGELEAELKSLVSTTKELIKADQESLKILKQKNALEKESLESLITGDLDKFLEGQAAVGATAAIATGDTRLMGMFGGDALGGAFKNIKKMQEAGVQEIHGVSMSQMMMTGAQASLGARGINDPAMAAMMAGQTAEEQAISSRIRGQAGALGAMGGAMQDMAAMQVQSATVAIDTAKVIFNDSIQAAVVQIGAGSVSSAAGGAMGMGGGVGTQYGPSSRDTGPQQFNSGNFQQPSTGFLGNYGQARWDEMQDPANNSLFNVGVRGSRNIAAGGGAGERRSGINQWNSGAVANAGNWARGGMIYANRGMFIPRGTDTVPAMLTPGEFVMNRASVNRGNNLQILQAMNNSGSTQAMSKGGPVQYLQGGGTAGAGGQEFSITNIGEITSAFTKFNSDLANNLKQLVDTKINIKLDTTNINVNLNGTSFLGKLKDELKQELLAEVSNQIGSIKLNQSGEAKSTPSVLT